MTAGPSYDPFDPRVQDDPYPIYRVLRDEYPVYRCPGRDTWVLSRHVDVHDALLDPQTFSSASGIFPTRDGLDMTSALLPMMIMMDPPRHTSLRQIVSRAFTPRRIATLESSVRTLTAELFRPLADARECDLVQDIAGPLPAMVIADLLGVPREDRNAFRGWSSALVQADPGSSEGSATALGAATSLYEYFAAFIADRRAAPQEDLITALVLADVDGRRLTDDELLGFCLLLLVAGHETTTNLIANAAVVLAEHPEARDRLAKEPALLAPAVEELLRYDSPVQGLARTLTRDLTVHHTSMSGGDTVLLLFGSANRDDRAFPDPDTFDLDRMPEKQVAFGQGAHFCLGASLARLEVRSILPEMIRRMPSWQPDLDNAQRLHSGPIRGYSHLPVRW